MRMCRTQAAFVVALAAFALLLSGCAKRKPNEPLDLTFHSLTGHVQLVGSLTAANGQFLGTRVVDDADGVPVDLLIGQNVVMRTMTSHGDYRFPTLGTGSYTTRSVVFGSVADSTPTLTVATTDVVAAHVLRLASAGDLYPAPNPIDARGQVTFEVLDDVTARFQVRNTRTEVVRTITTAFYTAGVHSTFWDGRDDTLGVMPPGYYWITFESGTDRRAQLLFK